MKTVRCLVVGDSQVGKTSLLLTYINKPHPPGYIPISIEPQGLEVTVDGERVNLILWDMSRLQDWHQLHPLVSDKSDVFVVCFSVTDPHTLESVRQKWIPTIKQWHPSTPFLLVGTKTDLRTQPPRTDRHRPWETPTTRQDGLDLARETGAESYLEWSAPRVGESQAVFDAAVRVGRSTPQTPGTEPDTKCSLM